jgi:hypothetical protein
MPIESCRGIRCSSRAGPKRCFNDNRGLCQRCNHAISRQEALSARRFAQRRLADHQALVGDTGNQLLMRARIDNVGATRKHRDREAVYGKRTSVCGSVNAKSGT